MDGWLDEWLDGWMAGWLKGWMGDKFLKGRPLPLLFHHWIPRTEDGTWHRGANICHVTSPLVVWTQESGCKMGLMILYRLL